MHYSYGFQSLLCKFSFTSISLQPVILFLMMNWYILLFTRCISYFAKVFSIGFAFRKWSQLLLWTSDLGMSVLLLHTCWDILNVINLSAVELNALLVSVKVKIPFRKNKSQTNTRYNSSKKRWQFIILSIMAFCMLFIPIAATN